MTELLTGPLGLVLVIAVMWWGISFNIRLRERYNCTACTFWGIAGGVAVMICLAMVWGQPFTWESAIVWAIAIIITLGLFLSNLAKSGSVLQGVLMTVWQLFVGLVLFGIYCAIDTRRKKK